MTEIYYPRGTQILFKCGFDNFQKYFLGIILDFCETEETYVILNVDPQGDGKIYVVPNTKVYRIT